MHTSRPLTGGALVLLALCLAACGGSGSSSPDGGDPPYGPPDGQDTRLDTDPLGAELSVFPEICGDGARVYAVWYDRRAGDTDVHFNRSLDAGVTWLAEDRRLDTDPPGEAGSNIPKIACAGAQVYVVWADTRAGRSQIRFNRSEDAGATWLAEDIRLDTSPEGEFSAWNVDIAASGAAIYVVWQDSRNGSPDIYVRRSSDAGATWGAPEQRLDADVPGASTSHLPRIATAGTAVYVVWQDDRSGETDVYFRRSLDAGASWGESDRRLDTDAPGAAPSQGPEVAASGERVVVAFSDARDGLRDIRVNASADRGATFLDADVRLDADPAGHAESLFPRLVLDGSACWVVWEDFRSGFGDVYLNGSEDGGASWSPIDVRLDRGTPGSASSLAPRIAGGAEALFVAFQDDRVGLFDVLLSSSRDGGASFSNPEIRMDTGPAGAANSLAPALFVSGGTGHVVWYDQRDGPGDIYTNQASAP